MSDFCDFVPDDPSCQVEPEPEPVEPVDKGDGMEPMDDEKDSAKAMEANINFLIAAVTTAGFNAVWLFRYRANSMFDTIGDTATSTNYWLLLDNLANYSSLLLHAILAIT